MASHTNAGAFAVAGTLHDASAKESAVVAGRSFVGELAQPHRFHFQNGISVGGSDMPFEWADLEYFASSIAKGVVQSQQYDVRVLCSGGVYSMESIFGSQPVAARSGRTALVVAYTDESISFRSSPDGRPLDASVLAPFSDVTIKPSVGHVDGFVVAKSLRMSRNGGSVQLHAQCFGGEFACVSAGLPACGAAGPHACQKDKKGKWRRERCAKKASKGKCATNKKVRRKCKGTCCGVPCTKPDKCG